MIIEHNGIQHDVGEINIPSETVTDNDGEGYIYFHWEGADVARVIDSKGMEKEC
uniref:Uncharacterized protein n=1 Tax=viral metagenome TaxID=1070528 RepID=A0A6M3IRZ6_9ZZZZ